MENKKKYKQIRVTAETWEKLKQLRLKHGFSSFDKTINVLIDNYNENKIDQMLNILFSYIKSINKSIDESKKEIINHISEIAPRKFVKKKFEKEDFRKWAKEEIKCRFCNSNDVRVTTIFVSKDGYMKAYRYVCNVCRTREKIQLPKPINLKRFYNTTLPPIQSTEDYAYPPRYQRYRDENENSFF